MAGRGGAAIAKDIAALCGVRLAAAAQASIDGQKALSFLMCELGRVALGRLRGGRPGLVELLVVGPSRRSVTASVVVGVVVAVEGVGS